MVKEKILQLNKNSVFSIYNVSSVIYCFWFL
jgi:hypothetical protein